MYRIVLMGYCSDSIKVEILFKKFVSEYFFFRHGVSGSVHNLSIVQ